MNTRQLSARRHFARFPLAAKPHHFVERLESRIAPAFTATLGGAAPANTWTGDAADDTLSFTVDERGNLMHNRFSAGDPGFASDIDLDSSQPGVQAMAAGQLTMVDVNAGAGDDTVNFGLPDSSASALTTKFNLDGGAGENAIFFYFTHDSTAHTMVITDTSISAAGGGVWTVSSFARIDLFGGSGGDTFEVRSGPNFAPISILGGAGVDHFTITGAADGSVFNGGPGADIYTASKFEIGPVDLTISFDEETEFIDSGDELTILGSAVSDVFALVPGMITAESALHFQHTGIERLAIKAGAGDDTITDHGELVPAVLEGDEGSDTYTIHFGAIGAPVTIDETAVDPNNPNNQIMLIGTEGSDHFLGSAGKVTFQDDEKRPPEIVSYFGDISGLKFEGVLGNDTFTLLKLGLPATVLGGGGADTFNILETDAQLTTDGQAGGDTTIIQVGAIHDTLTLTDTGTPGADRLFISGTIGADVFSFFTTHIDWSGPGDDGPDESVGFFYGTGVYLPAQIVIDARAGDDTFNVLSTAAGTSLLLDGGDGGDAWEVDLPFLSGKVTLSDHEFVPPASEPIPGNQQPNTLTVLGSAAADTIVATDARVTHEDHVLDFSGIDEMEILAGKGDDHVMFSNGTLLPAVKTVRISGGEGNDVILDSSHPGRGLAARGVIAIILEGDEGDDLLTGGGFANTILGGADNDIINGGGGNDFLTGGLGVNTIRGGGGQDTVIEAGDSDWTVTTGKIIGASTDNLSGVEHVQITGGDSANRIDATKFRGSVMLDGGAGKDILLGGLGADAFTGGLGDDMIDGGGGSNTLIETGDVDFTLVAAAQIPTRARVTFGGTLDGLGHDVLMHIARVTLTGGDSANVLDAAAWRGPVTLRGMDGDDVLRGGSADDFLSGGLGSNTISGGAGIDTLVEEGDVNFTLTNTLLIGLGTDVLDGIEKAILTGGASDNTIDANTWAGSVVLIGLDGNDMLIGGAGNDVLIGGNGDDVLTGGPGRDKLSGGPGNNTLTP